MSPGEGQRSPAAVAAPLGPSEGRAPGQSPPRGAQGRTPGRSTAGKGAAASRGSWRGNLLVEPETRPVALEGDPAQIWMGDW